MDIEFHYWLTGLIAKSAGFDEKEASTIAYASEFVDENDVIFYINKGDTGEFSNYISQTMNILKPKSELMRIYPIFHFIPGDPSAETARRRDGKMHLLNTTPDNENANALLDAAFQAPQDTRLYRIGIATHAYVDTWAHQNFVGWYDYFNNMGLDPKPDIGHADGEHHPDWVCHKWVDDRLVDGDINNRERFLSAAKALFKRYCHYIKGEKNVDHLDNWSTLEGELIRLMGSTYTGSEIKYKDSRMSGYRQTMDWLEPFNERKWFDEAVVTKVHGLRDSHDGIGNILNIFKDEFFWVDEPNKENYDWYRFQVAVKDHEHKGLEILVPTFAKMNINLRIV
jgi:hypothetical protein